MLVKPSLVSANLWFVLSGRTEYEADDQTDRASHHAAHLDYTMLARMRRWQEEATCVCPTSRAHVALEAWN
jgi:hypothetical protein